MATIRKRGAKWQVQVRRGGFAPLSKSFTHQRDAERWGVLKERELDVLESQGMAGAKACDLTVAELLKRYRLEVIPKKRSPYREACMVASLEKRDFAVERADKLTTRQIGRYRDVRLKHVGPATIVRELGLLQHAYETARKAWGYEGLPNPLRDVQRPRLPQGRARRLSSAEQTAIIASATCARSRQIVLAMTFALETSMRLGEIVAARWEHYDPDARVLLLPVTKSGKPRTIPLSRAAVEVLDHLGRGEAGSVFVLTAETLKKGWIQLTRQAGVPDFHFHDLRHEAISRLVEKGFDIPQVMMFSGHTDHRMLLRYTHLSARKLVAQLDAA